VIGCSAHEWEPLQAEVPALYICRRCLAVAKKDLDGRTAPLVCPRCRGTTDRVLDSENDPALICSSCRSQVVGDSVREFGVYPPTSVEV